MDSTETRPKFKVYDSKRMNFRSWLLTFRAYLIAFGKLPKKVTMLIFNPNAETKEEEERINNLTYRNKTESERQAFEEHNEDAFFNLLLNVDEPTQRLMTVDQEKFMGRVAKAKRDGTEEPLGQENDALRAVRAIKKNSVMNDAARLSMLESEWDTMMWNPNTENMRDFTTRVSEKAMEIEKCGGSVSEQQKILKVRKSLPKTDEWSSFKTLARQTDYETFEFFETALMKEIRGIEVDRKIERNATALNTTASASHDATATLMCFKCEKPGHMARDCPTKNMTCTNCHRPGHTAEQCWAEGGGKEGQIPESLKNGRGKSGKGGKGGKGGRGQPSRKTDSVFIMEEVEERDFDYCFNVNVKPKDPVDFVSIIALAFRSTSWLQIAAAALSGIAVLLFAVMISLIVNNIGRPDNYIESVNTMTAHNIPPKIFVDSACSRHMMNDRSLFRKLDPFNGTVNQAGKDAPQLKAEGIGDVKLKLRNESGKVEKLWLKNVYYVPTLNVNLLSTKQIRAQNQVSEHVKIGFDLGDENEFMIIRRIFDASKTMTRFPLNRSDETNELEFPTLPTVAYETTNDSEEVHSVRETQRQDVAASSDPELLRTRSTRKNGSTGVKLFTTDSTYDIWHARFGHVHVSQLKEQSKVVNDMKINGTLPGKNCTCEVCALQKAHKQPHPKAATHRATQPMELVHSDVQGPFDESIDKGHRWAINFVDDYSRFTAVYTMKTKDEALKYFKHFCAEYGVPKTVRTDNGGEYTSAEFENFCLDNLVHQETTVPHTPEQNGVAERSWRTLDEMARCNRHHANLKENFWAHAITASAHIRNRCITRAHQVHKSIYPKENVTPYELFHNEVPSVASLRVFGCTAYIHLNETERYGKWDDKAEKGIFVGYAGSKGWLVYVPRTNTTYVRRNVTFNERDFGEVDEDDDIDGVLLPEERDEAPDNDDDNAEETTAPEQDTQQIVHQDPPVRQSTRVRKQAPLPCEVVPRDIVSTSNLVFTRDKDDRMINSASSYLVSVDARHNTPKTFATASKYQEWKKSMERELQSHRDNGTWDEILVPLPRGKKAVGSKWVYRVKENSDGTVDVYKSRLVAQGFSQVEGIDFNETFAPTLRYTTLRAMLALAAVNGFFLGHLDVSTAYLYGDLDEEIYMKQPPGFEQKGPNGEELYCRLRKSLYGLKQAGRNWNILLDDFLRSNGFTRSEADPCLYIYQHENGGPLGSGYLAVAVYVDDILTMTNSTALRDAFSAVMAERFKISNKGDLEWFLGMRITRQDGCVRVDQEKYADDTAAKYNQDEAKSTFTPANENERLSKVDSPAKGSAEEAEMSGKPFMNLVGSLIYFMVSTRPEIAFATSCVSRYMNNYGKKHWRAAQRILQYIKTTRTVALVYGRQDDSNFTDNVLYGFSDSDWAADPDDRHSTTGYIFMLNGAAISWTSRKQVSSAQALSTTEAEYRAACEAAKEAMFLRALLNDLSFSQINPTKIYVDNTGAKNIAKNPVVSKRSKHIDLRYHYLRRLVRDEAVELVHVNTEDNVADMLTKPLGKVKLQKFSDIATGSRKGVNP